MRVNRVQIGVRRNDIDLVRLQRQRLCDLAHGHVNVGLEDFGQVALVLWRKMHDNHVGQAAVIGNTLEKRLQSGQAAGRSADAHNRQRLGFLVAWLVSRRRAPLGLRSPSGAVLWRAFAPGIFFLCHEAISRSACSR